MMGHLKFCANIYIQSKNIDISQKFNMAATADFNFHDK